MKIKHILITAATAAIGTAASHGAVINQWTFGTLPGGANNYGPSPFAAGTVIANTTSSGLIRGSGVGTTGTGAGGGLGGNAFTATTQAEAVTNSYFFSFTVTPDSGYAVSFSGIDAYNIRRSGTGPTTGIWQYSIGGGAFTNIGSEITWGANTTGSGNNQSEIDFSSISALQNVESPVTFRVANWGASSSGGTWYFNGTTTGGSQPLTLNGTVSATAVPEPSAALLGGLGLLALLRRRRA